MGCPFSYLSLLFNGRPAPSFVLPSCRQLYCLLRRPGIDPLYTILPALSDIPDITGGSIIADLASSNAREVDTVKWGAMW